MAGYPDPTTEDLESPEFNAIWEAIKGWDIQRLSGVGYAGATENDVMHIIQTLREGLIGQAAMKKGTLPVPSSGLRILNYPRQCGKTVNSLQWLLEHPSASLVVVNEKEKYRLLEIIREMHLDIHHLRLIVLPSLNVNRGTKKVDQVGIDNLDLVLLGFFGRPVTFATTTEPVVVEVVD